MCQRFGMNLSEHRIKEIFANLKQGKNESD